MGTNINAHMNIDNSEKWVIGFLERHGPSKPLLIVICKPIHIFGSVWNAINQLYRKGVVKYTDDGLVTICH